MTNLEYLREMSADELAQRIYRYDGCILYKHDRFCKGSPECDGMMGCPNPDAMCPECVKKWLMEEYEA